MAQTRQTIQNFYTQAQSKDFARDNLFRVLNINFGGGTAISFDDADSTGSYFMPTADSVIDLALLDKELDRVAQFQLVGVAIKSVGELSYDVTSDGKVQDFDVTVTYHFFRQTA